MYGDYNPPAQPPWLVNIKTTFGARGDGVTDDTAAFELAIQTVPFIQAGIILVPAGTYVITRVSHQQACVTAELAMSVHQAGWEMSVFAASFIHYVAAPADTMGLAKAQTNGTHLPSALANSRVCCFVTCSDWI